MKKITTLLCVAFASLTLAACGDDKTTNTPENTVEIDEKQIAGTITEVLKQNSEFDVNKYVKDIDINTAAIEDFFDTEKAYFRFEVQNQLAFAGKQDAIEIKVLADEYVDTHKKTLKKAKEKYDLSVTQDEVQLYIDNVITPSNNEIKDAYAEALGITVDEVNNYFDRDLYIMDSLWSKLLPAITEDTPRKDGEGDEEYMRRATEIFYK